MTIFVTIKMMTNYFGMIFVAIILIISCILFKTSRTFRYYIKYLIFTLHIGTFTAFLIPIFIFRPRNVKNLRLVIIYYFFLKNRIFYLEYLSIFNIIFFSITPMFDYYLLIFILLENKFIKSVDILIAIGSLKNRFLKAKTKRKILSLLVYLFVK